MARQKKSELIGELVRLAPEYATYGGVPYLWQEDVHSLRRRLEEAQEAAVEDEELAQYQADQRSRSISLREVW